MSSVGDRIRALREERGFLQRDIASPGVSYTYISRIESSERQPSTRPRTTWRAAASTACARIAAARRRLGAPGDDGAPRAHVLVMAIVAPSAADS